MPSRKLSYYAKALAEVAAKKMSAKESHQAAENFMSILEHDGYLAKANEIVALAEDYLFAAKGRKKITLETARSMTASQRKTLKGLFPEHDVIEEFINPGVIAGVKITVNDELEFDGSLHKKLQDIFS